MDVLFCEVSVIIQKKRKGKNIFARKFQQQEDKKMNGGSNQTIRCTVNQCRHHENSKNLCSLDAITVGTHEANPTQEQCTDCLSFEAK